MINEAALAAYRESQRNPPLTVTVAAHGQTFELALSNKYASAAEMVPLITRLFSKDRQTVVTSRALHARVGKSYKHNPWLERVKRECRLTEGEDFWEEEADPSTVEDRRTLAQSGGKPVVLTYFSLKAARKITLLSGTDEAHAFYEFIDAVLDAVAPKLLDEITALNRSLQHQAALADRNEIVAQQAMKQLGAPSVSAFEQASLKEGLLQRARAEAIQHQGAALHMWEQWSRAAHALEAGDVVSAKADLKQLSEKYGKYSDMLRHEPPWLEV